MCREQIASLFKVVLAGSPASVELTLREWEGLIVMDGP
jgi:hypothetical protein